ncbi:hypothetical protein BC829DRAFT_420352 [Chytridium lagenaria]|nr:hypothetical protein BC829DRAFT_420352 [Chytridium lagenaria]
MLLSSPNRSMAPPSMPSTPSTPSAGGTQGRRRKPVDYHSTEAERAATFNSRSTSALASPSPPPHVARDPSSEQKTTSLDADALKKVSTSVRRQPVLHEAIEKPATIPLTTRSATAHESPQRQSPIKSMLTPTRQRMDVLRDQTNSVGQKDAHLIPDEPVILLGQAQESITNKEPKSIPPPPIDFTEESQRIKDELGSFFQRISFINDDILRTTHAIKVRLGVSLKPSPLEQRSVSLTPSPLEQRSVSLTPSPLEQRSVSLTPSPLEQRSDSGISISSSGADVGDGALVKDDILNIMSSFGF